MAEEAKDMQVGVADAELVDEGSVIRLMKPMGGRTELVFDFGKITGAALLKCEREARKVDSGMLVPQLSTAYRAHVAAAATGIRYDDILALSGPDFTAATNKVASFLSGME